jgi:putative Mn2+ efflux pump MntP
MPLVGVALGAPLGHTIGDTADYIAGVFLIALGVYVLREGNEDDDEGERLLSMTKRGVYGAGALGVSISLDELAIGFSAGLLRLPLLPLIVALGLQAFAVTLLGVSLGRRVGKYWRESAERVAGAALIALGGVLIVLRVT